MKHRRLQYYLMPIGALLQCFVPRALAHRIACWIVSLIFPYLKSQRAIAAQNLSYILGRKPEVLEADDYARQLLRHVAISSADFLRAPLLKQGNRFDRIVAYQEHRRVLDDIMAKGDGAILVTGHIGAWDLAGVYIAAEGYPLVAVFERIPHGMSEVFNRFRGLSGMELIGMDERKRMEAAIRAGKLFVLLGDRDMRGNGQILPWFSGRRRFPRGAAAFSLRYGVPVIIGYFVLEPKDAHHRYRVVVEPPLRFQPSGAMEDDVNALNAIIVRRLEQIVGMYPDQWPVFQPKWLEGES